MQGGKEVVCCNVCVLHRPALYTRAIALRVEGLTACVGNL